MPQSGSNPFPTFDLALIRGEEGSESARAAEWERVFAHFQPRLLSYFERRANGILSLEDLLQEVWLRAFLNVKSLGSANALWTWLVTIGNNLLRDELRRNRLILESLPDETGDHAASIAEFLGVGQQLGGSLSETVEDMRAKLTEDEWEFLNLLGLDNLTHEEVAGRVGLKSAMASRQRLRRIRQRLLE
jgi:RNA polymerase sigma factor (sigma-70 family)